MQRLSSFLLVTILSVSAVPSGAAAAQKTHDLVRYRSATIDSAGILRITTSRGVEIRPEKVWDQVGFDQAVISPDSSAVGWLALFPNQATTYPIPLMLDVLWNGHMRAFPGEDLMIAKWAFEQRGRQVALVRTTVHGANPRYFELYDVRTGRKLAHYDTLGRKSPAPAWVRRLRTDDVP